MINWNDQDQFADTLWGEHKELDDHIVPQSKDRDGNTFYKFGRCSKKQKSEDCNAISSTMETCETKNNYLICNVKDSSGSKTNQELDDSGIDMDTWPDLPNLTIAFGGDFNDGVDRDSVVTGLVNDLDETSDLKSVGGFVEGYNHSSGLYYDKDSSSLNKTSILLSGNEMQLDGGPVLYGHDDKENDRFMDYDWANIEDFVDLDKMFRNNDSLFGNEMIDNTDTFLAASADLISSTSQFIPVPDLPISRKQTFEEGSSSHQFSEHSNVKINPLQKGKADAQNQTLFTKKKKEEKGKGGSLKDLNNSLYNKRQQISRPSLQSSAMMNPLHTFQSQPNMLADYGHPACQFHDMPLPPQIHAASNTHKPVPDGFKPDPDLSKQPKPTGAAASKPLIITPREKIEKLRRRQQMQAMLSIQKQRDQYNHQMSGCAEETPSEACSVEEAIYYQLQDSMGKLDMMVRLSIRDSLYRLARSALERQNVSDRSSTNESCKEEDETTSADEESNHDRYSRVEDCEAVTNHIDRIVAHLLFHNPSGSSLMPFTDGEVCP